MATELVRPLADQTGKPTQGDRGHHEDGDAVGSGGPKDQRGRRCDAGHRGEDERPAFDDDGLFHGPPIAIRPAIPSRYNKRTTAESRPRRAIVREGRNRIPNMYTTLRSAPRPVR